MAPLPSSEVRKIVTIIFSDLKGSTALTEKIDAEAINEVKERYFTSMAAEITRHGGKIEKYIGDAIMAVFGLPRAHEDDALRAVRAAYGMTVAMNELNKDLLAFYGVEIAARTGVNTGEVVANSDPNAEQRLATGDAVNVAARLEQAAPANEVLIGEVTYDLVRAHVEVEEVEPLELKGKAERVPAFKLLGVRDATELEIRHSTADAPLVGRDVQLDQLRAGLREVVSRGGARLTTIVGEAGVGKSYLAESFRQEVESAATTLRGRCLPYGDGITFWPLVEVVRASAGIVDDDTPAEAVDKIGAAVEGIPAGSEIRDRLASVVGLSPARFPVTELFWGARKYLEALSAKRPVVLLIEDVHNAEETFLDLVDHLLDATAPQSAVLIVATGRLSISEKRPGWSTKPTVTTVPMPPLDQAGTAQLVEVLLGGAVEQVVTDRVVASSEGNPLFVSQLVSMLVDKGLVHRHDDRWTASGDLASAAVPPTIQALLAARLDDLTREERAIMEPASVIGLAFPEPAIEELVPDTLRPLVPSLLRALSRKQFIDRDAAGASDDEIYRFRNLMIKDAVYGSLLKRARATTHERFVAWAERENAERGRGTEFEEIHGYHLEQAYRYRTELGPIDAEGRAIAERAAEKLSNAGRRAMNRGDFPASESLFKRAATVLQTDDPRRLDILFDLGEILIQRGELEAARAVILEGLQVADTIGDERRKARMVINELMHDQFTGSGSLAQQVERAREVIAILEPYEDNYALARAWNEIVLREVARGQYAAATVASDRVVELRATSPTTSASPGRSRPPPRTSWCAAPRPCRKGSRAATSSSRASGATGRPRRSCSVRSRSSRRWTGSSTRPGRCASASGPSSPSSGPRSMRTRRRSRRRASRSTPATSRPPRRCSAVTTRHSRRSRSSSSARPSSGSSRTCSRCAVRGRTRRSTRSLPKACRTRTTRRRRSRGAPHAPRCSPTRARPRRPSRLPSRRSPCRARARMSD